MTEDRSAMSIAADQNLHFGVLALQAGLLDALQFADACFVREALLMGQLAHPGIVPIHLVGETEQGTPYYVMKFVHGRTLKDAISAYHQKPSPLAVRDLLRHFGDVCQTIGFAHTQGVIHRDLKPSNIMLGDFGETLVLDWGLAKRLEPGGSILSARDVPAADQGLPRAGQIFGTPAYISPEQTNGYPAGLDISEQISREWELVAARQAAEQAAQAVSDRLENFQRQLRETLDEMVMRTERLLDTELSAEQRGYVTQVQTAGKGLLELT